MVTGTTGTTTAPLTPGQARLWLAERLTPGEYVVQSAVRVSGPLREDVLRACVARLVERHEALRTVLDDRGPEPVQVILDAAPDVVSAEDADDVDARVAELRARPFDLRAEPPVRVTLLRAGPEDHVLVFTYHHIAVDGWSLAVLVRELTELYPALAAGREPDLPPAPRFTDHARRARPEPTAALAHWRAELAGVPALSGPRPDLPPPARRGGLAHARRVELPAEVCAAVAGVARQARATPFQVLLGCFAAVLTGADDPPAAETVVGVPVAGRLDPADHRLVGFLVNVVPVRIACPPATTLRELTGRVRRTVLDAADHADAPFDRIAAAAGLPPTPRRARLAQSVFDLHAPAEPPRFPGARTAWHPVPPTRTRYEVELHLDFTRSGATGHLLTSADLFTADSAEFFRDSFEETARRWTADPGAALRTIREVLA
ncbi:condensation domain-containing protein [Saccharothrix sp. BKS2]|uniref:condensation domain-containing protein n=1 Tax=Saccharothrix sp. BKS2 TaxID=3064400 RepID=UPI0039EBEAB3